MSATVKIMCKWKKKHFKHPDMHMHIAIVDLICVVSEFFLGMVFFLILEVFGVFWNCYEATKINQNE